MGVSKHGLAPLLEQLVVPFLQVSSNREQEGEEGRWRRRCDHTPHLDTACNSSGGCSARDEVQGMFAGLWK